MLLALVPELAAPAAGAVFLGATVQSATGFGFALISGPVLFTVLQPTEAVTYLLVLGVASNLLVLSARASRAEVRRPDVVRVAAAALPGLVGGALLLRIVPKPVLQLIVGAGVLLAVVVQARRRPAAGPEPGPPPSSWPALVIGLTVGLLTTTTGTNGPPLVLWLERRRLRPAQARSTIAAMFLLLNVVGAAVLAGTGGGGERIHPLLLALLLAVAVAGYLAGALIFRRLDPRRFRTAGLLLCAAAGAAGIAAALLA